MPRLNWDQTGEKLYETGVDRGVVYPLASGAYPKGYAWNGLTNVTLTPSGAEPTPLFANNRKYANLISTEELGGSIESFTYPPEFAECNGLKTARPGVYVGQQPRKGFGFTYRSLIGNDTEGTKYGYKIHIVYGATASPSEDANATVNDSPEAKTQSWEFSTTPVELEGFDPTSHLEFNSTELSEGALKALEDTLYGTTEEEAHLPLPDEILALIDAADEGAA